MTYEQYKNTNIVHPDVHLVAINMASGIVMTYEQYKSTNIVHPELTGGGEIEQHISIIRNPKSRRGSFSSFAFPELHQRAKSRTEPENLLLLTRTRTDAHGRRHSVAV